MTAAIQPTSIAGLEDTNRVKKQNGMRLGRPRGVGKSKLDAYRVEIEALLKNGSTQKFSRWREIKYQ